MDLKQGEIIFKQFETGDHAYLIESGRVEIFHRHKNGQETCFAVLAEGEIFGEMALIDSNVRSATSRALTDCKLMLINKEQLLDKLESSDATVQMIMKMLLNRLRQQNQANGGSTFDNLNSNSVIAIDRLKLEKQISDAHQNNEFKMFHQTIIDLNTGIICGSEALIRWDSPKKGLISPNIFIDILEKSSMIIPIGYWIIEECFKHSKLLRAKAPALNFSVSINISARQLLNITFVETLKTLVIKHGVNPNNFKLEITERVLIEGSSVVDVLNSCHKLGFEISLDDFGTGFSSLQYLSQMPIDYLKIDRSFVMNVLKNDKTKAIVSAIIFLSKKLNLKVIAEGIETQSESQIMKELGSHFGQGYLYSKPVELNKLLEIL